MLKRKRWPPRWERRANEAAAAETGVAQRVARIYIGSATSLNSERPAAAAAAETGGGAGFAPATRQSLMIVDGRKGYVKHGAPAFKSLKAIDPINIFERAMQVRSRIL